jgi:hypothetical protein
MAAGAAAACRQRAAWRTDALRLVVRGGRGHRLLDQVGLQACGLPAPLRRDALVQVLQRPLLVGRLVAVAESRLPAVVALRLARDEQVKVHPVVASTISPPPRRPGAYKVTVVAGGGQRCVAGTAASCSAAPFACWAGAWPLGSMHLPAPTAQYPSHCPPPLSCAPGRQPHATLLPAVSLEAPYTPAAARHMPPLAAARFGLRLANRGGALRRPDKAPS